MDLQFNNTIKNTCLYDDDNYQTTNIVTALCLVVISITACGGNLLVIIAVCINRNLRSTSDLVLANLAVADLCQASIAIPVRFVNLLGEFQTNCKPLVYCPVVVFFTIFFGGASNLNILLVSVDRFIAIKWPFKYSSWVTARKLLCAFACGWVFVFLFSILPFVGCGKLENAVQSPNCRFISNLKTEYIIAGYILIHGFPLVTIIFIYLFILKATLRHSRAITAQEFTVRTNEICPESLCEEQTGMDEHQSTNRTFRRHRSNRTTTFARQKKAVRMVAVLLGVFIFLVLPIIVIDFVELSKGSFVSPVVVNVAICLIYANSGLNVFIYAGWNTEYRRTLHRILVTVWRCMICRWSHFTRT